MRPLLFSLATVAVLVAGCSSGSGMPSLGRCAARCDNKALVCGFSDSYGIARCGSLCAASPTTAQLICLDAIACADLPRPAPCGIVVDAGAPDAVSGDGSPD